MSILKSTSLGARHYPLSEEVLKKNGFQYWIDLPAKLDKKIIQSMHNEYFTDNYRISSHSTMVLKNNEWFAVWHIHTFDEQDFYRAFFVPDFGTISGTPFCIFSGAELSRIEFHLSKDIEKCTYFNQPVNNLKELLEAIEQANKYRKDILSKANKFLMENRFF